MALLAPTREFISYLQRHPEVRSKIRALPGKTLLYAGSTPFVLGHQFGYQAPVWREIRALKLRDPQFADKQILQDVLRSVQTPGTSHLNLLSYAEHIEAEVQKHSRSQPEIDRNQLVVWRALSGLFAANAQGAVSFWLGTGSGGAEKVFASTEVWVLLRNPKIDSVTRDMLAYYETCLKAGNLDITVSLMRA